MSVISVTDKKRPTKSAKRDGNRTYTRIVQIRTDSVLDGPLEVELGSGYLFGMPYVYNGEVDAAAVLDSRQVVEVEGNKTLWLMNLTYTTQPRQDEEDEEDDNPLNERPKISVSTGQRSIRVTEDAKGKKFINTRGDLIPGINVERNITTAVLQVRKNQASFNVGHIMRFGDSISAGPFLGAQPKHALMKSISASEEITERGVAYSVVNYSIEISKVPYNPTIKLENVGFYRNRVVDGEVTGEQIPILILDPFVTDGLDEDAITALGVDAYIEAKTPQFLDLLGLRALVGQEQPNTPEEELYIDFDMHDEENWDELGIF